MPMPFKKGDVVQQVVVPIVGEVDGFKLDEETGEINVLVKWSDESGDHQRYFGQSEIKAA